MLIIDDLTPKAEVLLKEILEHKDPNGNYSSKYWIEMFNGFSRAEDDLCRSCFKELSENDLVKVWWADGGPYYISVTSKGVSYFDLKEKAQKAEKIEKRKTVWFNILMLIVGAVLTGIVTVILKLAGIG